MTEAQKLWTEIYGSKLDSHSEQYKKYCLLIHYTKKKNVEAIKARINSNYFDRLEAQKLWKLIHKKK